MKIPWLVTKVSLRRRRRRRRTYGTIRLSRCAAGKKPVKYGNYAWQKHLWCNKITPLWRAFHFLASGRYSGEFLHTSQKWNRKILFACFPYTGETPSLHTLPCNVLLSNACYSMHRVVEGKNGALENSKATDFQGNDALLRKHTTTNNIIVLPNKQKLEN